MDGIEFQLSEGSTIEMSIISEVILFPEVFTIERLTTEE